MSRELKAVYEIGMLPPLEPVPFQENQMATLTIQEGTNGAVLEDFLDQEYTKFCMTEGNPTVTLEEVRKALSKIPGSLTADFSAEREDR